MIRELLARRRFMREHRFTQAHMSEYLDSELDRERAARVAEHAGICPECRRMLATLRRTLEGLGGLRAEARAGVAESVIERLRREA